MACLVVSFGVACAEHCHGREGVDEDKKVAVRTEAAAGVNDGLVNVDGYRGEVLEVPNCDHAVVAGRDHDTRVDGMGEDDMHLK